MQEFAEDVVIGDQPPSRWGREPLLCCAALNGLDALGFMSGDVVDSLQDVPGERWVRLAPQRSDWDGSLFCGAPAVLNRAADYRWRAPDKTKALILRGHEAIEPVKNLTIATRRWIASRVAWQLVQAKHEPGRDTSADEVARMLSVTVPVSADAAIAVRALLRERYELDPSSDGFPGFRGPDDWFAS